MSTDIERSFPEDPFEPTVRWIAVSQTPFSVPWAQGRVQIGASFNTNRGPNDALFLPRAAFKDLLSTPLHFQPCQVTSIRDESGTNVATSSSNTSFAISASIGGSFLGASGRGSYEKNMRDHQNASSPNQLQGFLLLGVMALC